MAETRRPLDVDFAILRAKQRARRQSLGTAIGMSPDDQQLQESTTALGIRKGTARFILGTGEGGVFGELYTTVEENGRYFDRVRKITDSAEAAYLTGVQEEVKSKKRSS